MSIFSVDLSDKTEKFWFWKSLKYFKVFNKKNYVGSEYAPSNSDWFSSNFVVWVVLWQEVEKYRF